VVERDDEAVARFIERFALVLTASGIQRMASRVFVALLVSDSGTHTAAELAELLRVSPAAVSGAVRYLVQVNLVERQREPGSRVDHYLVRNDVWENVVGQRDQVIIQWCTSFAEGIAVLGADTPAGARMAEALSFFEFLQKEMPLLMERWLAYKARN
jgi:predicted transcriptional regulator